MVTDRKNKKSPEGWLECEVCEEPATNVWECSHMEGIPLCEEHIKGYCDECNRDAAVDDICGKGTVDALVAIGVIRRVRFPKGQGDE